VTEARGCEQLAQGCYSTARRPGLYTLLSTQEVMDNIAYKLKKINSQSNQPTNQQTNKPTQNVASSGQKKVTESGDCILTVIIASRRDGVQRETQSVQPNNMDDVTLSIIL